MPLDLTNLHSAIQSRVNALGASPDEKTLLLLSKAIEAAIGNVTVSEINNAAASGVSDIEAKRVLEVQAILDAAAAKIAQINGLDALLKTGGMLTGPLSGTTINATGMNAAVVTADAASPSYYLREADAPADGKTWEVNAENQVLAFRIWNEAMSAYTSFLKFIRSGVVSIYVLFATAVRAQVVPLTDAPIITPNFNAGNVFSVTLGGNRTLANPSNIPSDHQGGSIIIRQDGTGSRTLSFGTAWKPVGGGIPSLSTTANAVDRLFYTVVSPTEIHCALQKDFR